MESSLTAPFDGRVRQVLAGANVHVAAQAPLARSSSRSTAARRRPAATASRSRRRAPRRPAPSGCREQLRRLEWLVLGYDIGAAEVERIVADLHGACADLLAATPRSSPASTACCGCSPTCARCRARATTRPTPRPRCCAARRSTSTPTCARSTPRPRGSPPTSSAAAARALAHYGIDDLDRTPALEEACYRLYLAQERAQTARAVVVAILDRRLEHAGAARRAHRATTSARRSTGWSRPRDGRDAGRRRPRPRGALPLLRRARHRRRRASASTPRWSAHVAALAADPARPDRDERIAALVACPRPLAAAAHRAHAHRRAGAAAPARRGDGAPLLPRPRARGLRARAHRRPRPAAGPVPLRRAGAATWRQPTSTSPTSARWRRAFARHAATLPDDDLAVLDLYAEHAAAAPTRDELAATLRAALAGGPAAAGAAPDRRGRRAARARARDVGHRHVHLPPSARGPRRGRGRARPAPDDGPPAAPVAAARTSPSSACRRPRTSTSSTAWRTPTPRTSGCSRSPRCAT